MRIGCRRRVRCLAGPERPRAGEQLERGKKTRYVQSQGSPRWGERVWHAEYGCCDTAFVRSPEEGGVLQYRGEMLQEDIVVDVQRLVNDYMKLHTGVRVLEAGCGSCSYLRFPGGTVSGIDISAAQLERHSELHERILGDLEAYPFIPSSFDIVVCWDVLEHLRNAQAALENLSGAVRGGGLVIIKVPNLFSIKGLVARLTPHAFHVWFYRRVVGKKDAGVNDTGPFPTHFKAAMWPSALRRFAGPAGCEVLYQATFARFWRGTAALHLVNTCVRLLALPLRVISLGVIRASDSEYIIVYRKETP